MSTLDQAIAEATAVLVEIEVDPTRALLAGATLTGTTQERWTAVDAALRDAWAAQAGLEERPQEIQSPVARMRAAGEQAQACLAEVAAAWDAHVPRLRAINATLRACTASPLAEHRELQRLTALVTGDPLGPHDEPIAALEAAAERLRDFREQAAERLAGARAQLEEARALETEARAAHAAVLEKIADPDVPAPLAVADELERELDGVAERADAGDWAAAHAALEAWTARTAELVREQRRIVAANRAPVQARRELRGLLDAYHAKAGALRALEDPALCECFERAEQALHTAPTDLAEATRLVHRYRDQLPAGVRR